MPIYELTSDRLVELPITSFATSGIRERHDLQRVLRDQIGLISPDTLIIAEEFADWCDSRRRIDLLGIDKQANLVVIELKRTDDGGHMELQAIRYAAMVSVLTFEKAFEIYGNYLRERGRRPEDASQALLDFLGWTEPDEQRFGQDVRIVLASADFSKELTTSVLWLNDRNLNIRCVRLRPYTDGHRTLIDIHQVIPLAEASDYLIGVREKASEVRKAGLQEAAWEGDWYVNLGMDDPGLPETDEHGRKYERHWSFCKEFGYVAAGRGPKYWKPLVAKLKVGDRVWVYQRQAGYVGTGIVTHAAVPMHQLVLPDGTRLVERIGRVDVNENCEPDNYEYAVGIKWDATVSMQDAKTFAGAFANQNIVCRLTHRPTLTFLRGEFPLTDTLSLE